MEIGVHVHVLGELGEAINLRFLLQLLEFIMQHWSRDC